MTVITLPIFFSGMGRTCFFDFVQDGFALLVGQAYAMTRSALPGLARVAPCRLTFPFPVAPGPGQPNVSNFPHAAPADAPIVHPTQADRPVSPVSPEISSGLHHDLTGDSKLLLEMHLRFGHPSDAVLK